MLNVSDYLKEFYMEENSRKHIKVLIGDRQAEIPQEKIVFESMELTEAISDDDNLQFVGCCASQFKLTVSGVRSKLKDQKIEAYVTVNGQPDIPLFHGYIDSANRTSNKRQKEIIAYDYLYSLSQRDVSEFINEQKFPMTLKAFRDAFFDEIAFQQVKTTLKSDNIEIPNPKAFLDDDDGKIIVKNVSKTIYALDVLKSICQMEGKFGIINRNGVFEYREMKGYKTIPSSVPGASLIPPFVLMSMKRVVEDGVAFPSYRTVDYAGYEVNNVKRVRVQQEDESDVRGTYGNQGRMYKVMGNFLTRYADKALYDAVAQNIYNNIKDTEYTPFTSENIGLPYLEVGDGVQFYVYEFEESERLGKDVYALKSFIVQKRVLSGIMSMKDTLSAKGVVTEGQFLSDLGWKNETDNLLEKKVEKNTSDIKELQDNSLKVLSVAALPSNPDNNTIYLIQGTVG